MWIGDKIMSSLNTVSCDYRNSWFSTNWNLCSAWCFFDNVTIIQSLMINFAFANRLLVLRIRPQKCLVETTGSQWTHSAHCSMFSNRQKPNQDHSQTIAIQKKKKKRIITLTLWSGKTTLSDIQEHFEPLFLFRPFKLFTSILKHLKT